MATNQNDPSDKPEAGAPATPAPVDEVDRDVVGESSEFQPVNATRNPRADVLKRLAGGAAVEQGHDESLQFSDAGERPVLIRKQPDGAPAAEAQVEAFGDGATAIAALPVVDEGGQPAAAAPVEGAPVEPAPEKIKLNVLGREQEFSADDVLAAGIATLQKQGAADIRLREASALLDEAQRIRDAASGGAAPRPAPAATGAPAATADEAQRLADALIAGDRVATTAAIAEMMNRGVNAESLDSLVSRSVATHVNELNSHREAVQQLETAVPELKLNPWMKTLAANEERRLRMIDAQNGVRRSYAEVYSDVARNITTFKQSLGVGPKPAPAAPGNSGGTLQTRLAAKTATPAPVVGAGGRPATPTTQQPPSGSAIVERMRAKRGQTQRI